jgi:2-iminobutanoate/2-iminopropanoate deaminase
MKKIISTNDAPKAIAIYSQAVEINGMLFISGQLALDPVTGQMVEGGITEQTQQVLKNIAAILKEAGYEFKDVVKTTCLITDMANFGAMNEVYGKIFHEKSPARATFAALGLPLGAMVEIEAIAVRDA